jgi:hypothetical protein
MSAKSFYLKWQEMSFQPLQARGDHSLAERLEESAGLELQALTELQADHITEFERILLHEDFKKLFNLSNQVKPAATTADPEEEKEQTASLKARAPNNSSDDDKKSKYRLILDCCLGFGAYDTHVIIPRGMFCRTDSFLDEAIHQIATKLPNAKNVHGSTTTNKTPSKRAKSEHGSTEKKGKPIAVKLSKARTDILIKWMIVHRVRLIETNRPDKCSR